MSSPTALPPLPLVLDIDPGVSSSRLQGFGGTDAPQRAAHEEIMHRAYSIWECAGRPENCGLEHWLAAEAEVLAEV